MIFKMTPMLKFLLISNIVIYIINNLFFSSVGFLGVPASVLITKYFALQPLSGLSFNFADFTFYPWQLITYQFLHANFSHLFFNMFALWMFSSDLEEVWGSAKFVVFYLLSGIGAGITHLLIAPLIAQAAPTIGASGSLYGIIIAFAMMNPDRKIMVFPIFIPIPARIFGIGMIALSAIMGFSSADGVAHFAHFGGAITGLLLLKFAEKTPIFRWARKYIHVGIPSSEFVGNYRQKSNMFEGNRNIFNYSNSQSQDYNVTWQNPNEQNMKDSHSKGNGSNYHNFNNIEIGGVKITQDKIDAILDKISKSGYQSLSEQEKYILTEISKRL